MVMQDNNNKAAQDQLIYSTVVNPNSIVPDGGITAMMLGIAFTGTAFVSRRFRRQQALSEGFHHGKGSLKAALCLIDAIGSFDLAFSSRSSEVLMFYARRLPAKLAESWEMGSVARNG